MNTVPGNTTSKKDEAPRSLQQTLDDAQNKYMSEVSEAWIAWQQRIQALQFDLIVPAQKAWRTLDASDLRQAQTTVQREFQEAGNKLNERSAAAYKKYTETIRTSLAAEKPEALDPMTLALLGQSLVTVAQWANQMALSAACTPQPAKA